MQGIASGIMIVIILVTRPGYFQNGVKLGGLFNLVNANIHHLLDLSKTQFI